MSDTTNIMDLPTDPVGGGNVSNNISLSTTEQLPNANAGVSLDQTTINQIVNGLQQASASGATQLPSRNIPQMTIPLTQDPVTQPNYIPPTPVSTRDYIQEDDYETNEEIIKKYRNNFSTLLMILGLAIISVIVKMFLMPFTLANILDMLVLGGIAVLILNKKKIGKQIMAVYALGPILVTIIWGSVGNVIIWPFAFFASAQSLLIQSILNEESEE